ncbi:MAG: response regulator [Oscillospiraceae bacterium]|jgi:putative two-component system response regulator|nr:response regulator [Oscillospiraceae bacterium]
MKKTIFIVDDNDTNLTMAKDALKKHYRVMTLPSAKGMFTLLERVIPDLILLDIKMPEMDGFEALNLLKEDAVHADIPVIFLTNLSDTATEARGFQLGVVDFIIKPFSEPVLLNRIKSHLDIDTIIRERTAELQQLQNSIVFVVADMVEMRDSETGGHVERTTKYLKILLDAMQREEVYTDEISDLDFEIFASSARLHDVGKVAISDTILNKPGKLTDEEFTIMKTHAEEGMRIIEQIVTRSGSKEFLENAKLFAGYHHERWDGKGYPHGLAGADIPLQGRIMAFADVYDALISIRPYKNAFSHDEAIKIIMDGAGTQFDPVIAKVFYDIKDQFNEVNMMCQYGSQKGKRIVEKQWITESQL